MQYLHKQHVAHNLFMARAPSLASKESTEDAKSTEHAPPTYVTAYIYPRRSIIGTLVIVPNTYSYCMTGNCITGAKPAANFNPAACELSGMLLIYSKTGIGYLEFGME